MRYLSRNSFGHWENNEGFEGHGTCLICGAWRYEELCTDCKRPKYLTVANEKQLNAVAQEGYEVIGYQMSTVTRIVRGGDKLEITERFLLKLTTPERVEGEA